MLGRTENGNGIPGAATNLLDTSLIKKCLLSTRCIAIFAIGGDMTSAKIREYNYSRTPPRIIDIGNR